MPASPKPRRSLRISSQVEDTIPHAQPNSQIPQPVVGREGKKQAIGIVMKLSQDANTHNIGNSTILRVPTQSQTPEEFISTVVEVLLNCLHLFSASHHG